MLLLGRCTLSRQAENTAQEEMEHYNRQQEEQAKKEQQELEEAQKKRRRSLPAHAYGSVVV